MEDINQGVDRITITGIGLVTSLGLSAPSSLAAIRGGIANYSEHETVMVNGDYYGTELSGALIARTPEHFLSRRVSGIERAVSLLAPAIQECTRGLPGEMLSRVDWRLRNWIEPWRLHFIDNLAAKLGYFPASITRGERLEEFAPGRCLFFEDIIQAIADLRTGSCRMALVGCVDSLCETTVLDRLFEMDRLKSGTNAAGLIAGEAAGAVLLELESNARSRNASLYSYISAWGRGSEADPWTATAASTANGLSIAFREAFAMLSGKGAEVDVVIADLNGEHGRACELAMTEGRLFPADDKIRELKHPADCTGDCGAAMGTVLLSTALGLMSAELPPSIVAMSTSDDGGARHVLCLEKGDHFNKDEIIPGERQGRQPALPNVIDQHNDEVSFLWLQRNHLIEAPHCTLVDLEKLDERLEAHIDGLRVAGEAGWEICAGGLARGYLEEYFAPAILAFESGMPEHVQQVVEAVGTDRTKARALISALGWLSLEKAEPHIKNLLASDAPFHRYIGIAASAIHRHDPGRHLDASVYDADPLVLARGLRAYGELGRGCEINAFTLRECLWADDDAIRFSVAWSATLAGNQEALEVLKSFVTPESPYKERALNTALRRMDPAAAFSWQRQLAESPQTIRCAVVGVGIIGDPVLVPWLMEQMKTPALARVAGEAFTLITGVDMHQEELRGKRPEEFTAGPNDDPDDDNVALDADLNLPWPNAEPITWWWDRNNGNFPGGSRYILGKTVSVDHLRHILKTGLQRQRAAAALELAIMQPGQPLFNVRAPGSRQRSAAARR